MGLRTDARISRTPSLSVTPVYMAILSPKALPAPISKALSRSTTIWPDGYDALNRPTAVTEHTGGGALAAYAYDALGRRTSVSYNSGTSAMSYTYTDAGDLLTLTDDLAGTANDVTFTDTYTNAHQLASEAVSNAAYSYTTAAAPTAYAAVNTLNQYTTVGGSALTWDANGNLATASTGTYTHDPENRMTRAIVPGATDSNYTYDPLGRRVAKAIATIAAPLWGSATWNAFTWTAAATTATTYLHAGSSEIAEYNGAGALVRRFVPGPSVDEFIAMVTAAGTKTFVHVNRQGSVIATADTSGAPAEGPYTYDAYGNCFTSAGASCTTLAATTVPFRFTGQRFDAETNLYYYKARYYCVTIGRFCETDPAGYAPDVNWYVYVGNDPTNKSDPSGEDETTDALLGELRGHYAMEGPGPHIGRTRADERGVLKPIREGVHATIGGTVNVGKVQVGPITLGGSTTAAIVMQSGGTEQSPDIGVQLSIPNGTATTGEPGISVEGSATVGLGAIDLTHDSTTVSASVVPVSDAFVGPSIVLDANGNITDVGISVTAHPEINVTKDGPAATITLGTGISRSIDQKK